MVSFKNLGNHGRLGNQLFQYAFLRLTARRLGVKFYCPHWAGDELFLLSDGEERAKEPIGINKHYIEPPYFGLNESALRIQDGADILGYFQTEKYFKNNEDEIKKWYTFQNDKVSETKEKYKHIDFSKSVGMSLRFGNIVNTCKFVIVPQKYYIDALSKVKNKKHILAFSDDHNMAKKHLSGMKENFIYMEGHSPGEQLYLMSQCHDFICSVSTFSWWGAWLNSYKDKIIVCPKEWIRPGCYAKNDDLCCDGWISLRTTIPVLDDYRLVSIPHIPQKILQKIAHILYRNSTIMNIIRTPRRIQCFLKWKLQKPEEQPTVHFVSAIWNRGKHLKELVDTLNRIYKNNKNFKFHLCDYYSTDIYVEDELKRLSCEYTLIRLNEKFNYGKGWNIGARNVPTEDIIALIAIDIKLPKDIIEKIHMFTNRGKTFFGPECGTEEKDGRLAFRHGGYGFISVYKSDYSKTGGVKEKTTWGGEETGFIAKLKDRTRVKEIRYKAKDIILKWHERDFSATWYKDSEIARSGMYTRKWWRESIINIT